MTDGFKDMTVSIPIHLLPSRLENVDAAVEEALNSLLMTFVPQVNGIVLCYDKVKFQEEEMGSIFFDRPHISFNVNARFLVFSPTIGTTLTGVVNKVANDHISLLTHGVFNVVINAKGDMPSSYQFETSLGYWFNTRGAIAGCGTTIEEGTRIVFKISSIEQFESAMYLVGSIKDGNTGPLRRIMPSADTAERTSSTSLSTSLLSHVFGTSAYSPNVKIKKEMETSKDKDNSIRSHGKSAKRKLPADDGALIPVEENGTNGTEKGSKRDKKEGKKHNKKESEKDKKQIKTERVDGEDSL